MSTNFVVGGDKMKYKFLDEFKEESEDFYSEKVLEESVEDDEISGMEEGFMRGYLGN